MSSYTKKAVAKLWVLRILNLALLIAPLMAYICVALGSEGVVATQKVSLIGTVAVALILVTFNLIAKKALRSPIWIVLIGLYFALKELLLPLVIMLAVATILDEFLFTPWIQKAKMEVVSNKTMDKRGD